MTQALLTETAGKLGTELQWGWDERWNSALMVLQGEEGQAFLGKLADVFGDTWDHENITSAEQIVQTLAQDMGGLRAGQKLYSKAAEDGVVMYAASWPWVGNSHLSIRVGIFGGDHHLSVRTIFAPDSFKPKG
jgi:hypothetical protein